MSKAKMRFAPSPTGFMHIGNARTALFNYLFAQKEQGSFLLRIEDTDRERSREEYSTGLEADLKWLSMPWNEGPGADCGNGPYNQAQRQTIYDKYYEQLEQTGQAYPCFCSEEDLSLLRKVQLASGKPPRYNGQCRKLSKEEVAQKLAAGEKAVLRFHVPEDGQTKFLDLSRGEQVFNNSDIGDFIIRRTDGSSPFMFCSAIDDALMGVTHVLRGEDHLTNTPRQLMILDALKLPRPHYGHIALIVGPDGSPLSKRHGSRSIHELRAHGYLAIALNNYMARLGHYYPDGENLLSMADLAAQFKIESLTKSAAKFNVEQLDYWQKQALAKLNLSELKTWLGDVINTIPDDKRDLFLTTIQPNAVFPADFAEWADVCFNMDFSMSDEAQALLAGTKKEFFQTALHAYKSHKDLAKIIEALKEVGYKGKNLFQPLRVALTGHAHGPELDKLVALMEASLIEKRLDR